MLIVSSFLDGDTTIFVDNPGEKPWVNLTLSWLDRGGVRYQNYNFEKFIVHGTGHFQNFNYTVPSDFSSLAYPVVAALLTHSEIEIENVDMEDSQGDKLLLPVLEKMGANLEYDKSRKILSVRKTQELIGMEININDFIDSITILAVIGCFAKGKTVIKGAASSRYKECNRISCIKNELSKMGADISELDDGLVISPTKLKGCKVESYNDHRMALSLAIAGMCAEGVTEIQNSKCIDKSFPGFVVEMIKLGGSIKISS